MHELETTVAKTTLTTGVRIDIRGNELAYTHWLAEGESVMIGSDEQCRIRVVDPSVSQRQCLIQLRAGQIFVHDWAAENPTLVNGEPADSSIGLTLQDCIAFGDFNLEFHDSTAKIAAFAESLDKVPRADSGPPAEEQNEAAESESLFAADEAWDELTDVESALEPLPQVSVESSTIELLTTELEILQAELSEKNAVIADYSKGNRPSINDEACAQNELERRIELLLFELDQSDQRVSAMEEVMRLSEEWHDAELEEKRQLEAWVNDIEDRLAARELETNAECEVLRKRLEQAKQDRNQAEGRITNLIDDGGSDDALQGMVQVLRHENEQLRGQLEEKSKHVKTLEKELEELKRNSTEEAIQRRIGDALRVERLELAQEKAALSRQQLVMSANINELEQQIDKQTRRNPADEKFRAFRDQLKELHEQEKRDYVPPTLTQRLVNVWRKLDGPTDTD